MGSQEQPQGWVLLEGSPSSAAQHLSPEGLSCAHNPSLYIHGTKATQRIQATGKVSLLPARMCRRTEKHAPSHTASKPQTWELNSNIASPGGLEQTSFQRLPVFAALMVQLGSKASP